MPAVAVVQEPVVLMPAVAVAREPVVWRPVVAEAQEPVAWAEALTEAQEPVVWRPVVVEVWAGLAVDRTKEVQVRVVPEAHLLFPDAMSLLKR
jgi:hypothetical protein